MLIYAGIDEAGYGPMFGPLTLGRAVFALDDVSLEFGQTCDLWQTLAAGVCRKPRDKQGRIAINDSKKLHTQAAGVAHLEQAVLALLGSIGKEHQPPGDFGLLLDRLGLTEHRELSHLPWYDPAGESPWQTLPTCHSADSQQLATGLLHRCLEQSRVRMLDLGVAVIFEDRFNDMVAKMRSKAAVSFHFLAQHLRHIWDRFGKDHPTVIVDRQSGRMHYRELLEVTFGDATLRIVDETRDCSHYQVRDKHGRSLAIQFVVNADDLHMPTAVASMTTKYVRELFMARLNAWFCTRLPDLKPCAGYGADAKRYWLDVQPHLRRLGVEEICFRRQA